jgi:glycosyltransferase involved in cell wall biosynthesis
VFYPSSKATDRLVTSARCIALAWVDPEDPTDRVIADNLAAQLRQRGHRVLIVGPHRGSSIDKNYRLVGTPALKSLPWLNDVLALIQLLWLHVREGVDLWHCHVFGRSHRPWMWARRIGAWRTVATLHLVLGDYMDFIGGIAGLRRLLAGVAHVTVVSQANRAELLTLLPEWQGRSSVVYSYGPGKTRSLSDEKPAKRFILCPARIAPYKGIDILLMAFADIAERDADLELVICGRDQMKGAMQKFVATLGLAHRVQFAGEVPREQLRRWMQAAQVTVLPSRRDNFPIVLLEAMAEGASIVASRVGGIPEMIREGVDGELCAPGNVAQLSATLTALLADAPRRAALGCSARERSKDFSWQRAAKNYTEIYERCLR